MLVVLLMIRPLQVTPFVRQLKAWIKKEKRRSGNGKPRTTKISGSVHNLNGTEPFTPEHKALQAEIAQAGKPLEPGQSWINFKFCHEEILKHLLS